MSELLNGNKEGIKTLIECLQQGAENSYSHMNVIVSSLEDGKNMPEQMCEGLQRKMEHHKEMQRVKNELVDKYSRSLEGTFVLDEAEMGIIYKATADCLTDEIDNYFNDICDIDHNTEVSGTKHPNYKMDQSDKAYILEMRGKCLSLYEKYFA